MSGKPTAPPRTYTDQPRVSADVDHIRPHRWNWSFIVRPIDQQLVRQTQNALPPERVFSLRYFWLDGLFSAISENFYLSYMPLFALAYGATNEQVGWLTALANLLGALSLFPGARLVDRTGQRKRIVLWSGGGLGRLLLLGLASLPLLVNRPILAIWLIVLFNSLRTFFNNLGNPAWTALVADLVPDVVRGRYFSSRNMAMGLAALLIAPLAGRLIRLGNDWADSPYFGYQLIFGLAFAFGMVSTASFGRIRIGQQAAPQTATTYQQPLWPVLRRRPSFLGFVASAFVFNLALQVAAPFFNVYLVRELGASTTMVGLLASVSSLTALGGQQVFGRLLDRRGAIWVQLVTGILVPLLPLAWIFITAPWQVAFINTLGGFAWAGYNLSNFNLLLELTPDEQRPRAVALYQTAVFSSAVLGPLLGGFLADRFSFQLIFGLSGVGRLAGTLIFFWFTVRRLQSAARTATPAPEA